MSNINPRTQTTRLINFRQQSDVVPSVLILLSILILAGTLITMLVVHKPSVAGVTRGRELSRQKLVTEIADVKARTKQTQALIGPHLWTGDPQTVTAAVLTQLTKQTGMHAVKLTAFRPQRSLVFAGTTELLFSVQMSGSYPAVRAVISSLDAADSKVVLGSIQIASAEGVVSSVSATLVVSAFIGSLGTPSADQAIGGTNG